MIEDIEYYEDRRLDKAQILRFATCNYMGMMQHDRQEILAFLERLGASQDECRETWRWIRQGHNLYDNPWFLYNESGWPMDYVSALRVVNEIADKAF